MMSQPEKNNDPHSLDKLNSFILDSLSADQELFAEMRSNLLLINGEHYTKGASNFFRRIRDSQSLSQEQKLRLTKNHVQKIHKTYVNNLISQVPGVGIEPKNDSELQDQKAAELHHAVWQDACDKYDIESSLIDQWAEDFFGIGEVATKIFFDPNLGEVKAYEQKLDEQGQPMFDEQGQPVPDETLPHFTGGFVFERIFGFNLFRDASAKSYEDSPWVGLQKMVDKNKLKKIYPSVKDSPKLAEPSPDETTIIFDPQKGGFSKSKDQVLIYEVYFRPCAELPQGYFYHFTKTGKLVSGTLPAGVFPIVFEACEKIQTSPRGRSPVKTMRPYQAEINRAGSKMAEHQVTLGDDKILLQKGTEISAGIALPGIRSINYTGMTPQVLNGRSGEQYLNYMNTNITELYAVMNVDEGPDKNNAQLDPYAMLYRSASQKMKFKRYVRPFERFLCNVAKTYLKLAKYHLDEEAVILAVGRSERVNISEFKNSSDLGIQIRVRPQSDDIETRLGKQLSINHIIQYAGQQMSPEALGRLVRELPYGNLESFVDLTLNADSGTNDILALDRGEIPVVAKSDDHVYIAKRLASRMRQADFKFLSPQIQQNYANVLGQHEQLEAERQLEIQRMKSGYIPTGGGLIIVDLYVNDPSDPKGLRTMRARIPYESLQWLVKQLEAQGQSLQQLMAADPGVQQGVSEKMLASQMVGPQRAPNGMGGGMAGQQPGFPSALPPRLASPGNAMPTGVENVGRSPAGVFTGI